ncbi:hypothetical protein [Deinococcus wulumuqiensis]|uniref:DUF2203 family protein n=1 Tax=Deinococcus wulumuqiensis TaxID=980427 RepID=A0AAV4K3F9_9DEIO|nr:hypothetical protein [Deinococcus wulumuqiensis]QII20159.1 hypothetical protein G6R31_04790 [Deinococcus wulumuqiensis R12]GGI75615.1 hypothetical protein GCM10010914_07280 [Deinococcus wulumuqiensis]GGP28744.1 hypothetical protein GCM10008021_03950 [Deinococcus wulumuqiensis]
MTEPTPAQVLEQLEANLNPLDDAHDMATHYSVPIEIADAAANLIRAQVEALVEREAPEYRVSNFGKRGEVLYRGEGVPGQRIVLWRVWEANGECGSVLQSDEEAFDSLWHPIPTQEATP